MIKSIIAWVSDIPISIMALFATPLIGSLIMLWGVYSKNHTYTAVGAGIDIIFICFILYLLHDICIS